MPILYTTLVAQAPDAAALRERFASVAKGEGFDGVYESETPRDPAPGRVRLAAHGRHHAPVGDKPVREAVESGALDPLEWAVVLHSMDQAMGVNARVYDGRELVDEFRGVEGHSGADTTAYLERYHGVLVWTPTPLRASRLYHPSLDLAHPDIVPERSLADEPPTGPFEVQDLDDWLVVKGVVDDADGFRAWFGNRLRDVGLVLAPRTRLVNRSWVARSTTLEPEPPTEAEVDTDGGADHERVRFGVPLSDRAVTPDGLSLSFGTHGVRGEDGYESAYGGALDWLVACYGDGDDGRVDGYMFVHGDRGFTHDDALDIVRGADGADVAAYLRQYYDWQVDPTPADRGSPPETDELPDGAGTPTARVAEALREAETDPGPAMPDPDPDEVAAAKRAADAEALAYFLDVSEATAREALDAADGDFVAARDALEAATDAEGDDRTVLDRVR